MAAYPNIAIHKRLEIEWQERKYFFTHGHRWAIDWGWLGLRRVAPWFVEIMVDIAPSWWYKFCRWRGWLASHPTRGAAIGRERERITNLSRIIWAGAADHALKHDCCVVLGHNHTAGRRERAASREIGSQSYMLDEGDLPDGTYAEITDDARVQWL